MYQELQLEAKELDIEIEKTMTAPAGENSTLHVEDVGAFESKESHGDFFKLGESLNLGAGEPLLGIEAPSVSELTHLNERILQLQKKCIKLRKRFNKDICRGDKECMTNVDECKSLKTQSKELDKSLDTPTEDDGY